MVCEGLYYYVCYWVLNKIINQSINQLINQWDLCLFVGFWLQEVGKYILPLLDYV